jgi:pantothenate kinase-related protein Tda10
MALHIVDIETKSETETEPNLREFFVIIRGSLGAGKTTASLKLSEAIGAAYVSIDDIWKEITLKSGGELTLR